MKKSEFNNRVKEMCDFIKAHKCDNMRDELIQRNIRDPFMYGAWCEKNFEANLREDYERKTTYTSDFSIAEWCVPVDEFFAEIIIVLNMKAWEHAARGNRQYAEMYSQLYLDAKCLYFGWFDKNNKQHGKAMEYYFDYVD